VIQVHLLVSLHLVGTWVFICCEILVFLDGCHHLDSLEQREEVRHEWSLFVAGSGDCEGLAPKAGLTSQLDSFGSARSGSLR
jgi:hypothetical protein